MDLGVPGESREDWGEEWEGRKNMNLMTKMTSEKTEDRPPMPAGRVQYSEERGNENTFDYDAEFYRVFF